MARVSVPTWNREAVAALSEGRDEPAWLKRRRLDAWRAFESMAMPNPLAEEWRRTDISALDVDAALAAPAARKPVSLPRDFTATDGLAGLLVQSDGATQTVHRSDSLPAGVVFGDLHAAAREHKALVEPHLHSLIHASDWRLQALQVAAWQGGAFVYVPRNTEVELPLRVVTGLAGSFLADHLLIVAGENSSVSIIHDNYSRDAKTQSLVSAGVEIVAQPNARVRFVETQLWGAGVYSFTTIRAHLERGAELHAGIAGLGAQLARAKLEVTLEGEGSSAELLGLSFGKDKQHFDYATLQDHIGPRTSSDLLFKAALDGAASTVWNGLARIHRGSSQSEANQTSRNLLLSDHARAAPIPVLEIEAYDVLRCSHGASAGPVDEEQLFYLESRGIPPAEAERLLVEAFFQEIVDRFPEARSRDLILKELAARIGGA